MKKVLFSILIFLSAFLLGIWAQKKGFPRSVKQKLTAANSNRILIKDTKAKVLKLLMEPNKFEAIRQERDSALARGFLNTAEIKYQKGKMVVPSGDTIRIRMRLKGDLPDHYESEKQWSFRIRTRKGDVFEGLQKFSIQKPSTRNFIYEWLYHEIARNENLPALQYDFYEVYLNEDRLGLYAFEQHFDKLTIEDNNLREGVIIRLNETGMWGVRNHFGSDISEEALINSYRAAAIQPYQPNRIAKSKQLTKQFMRASANFASFRNDEAKIGDVFDLDKMAKFSALCDVLGGQHGLYWNNRRFYFNPLTNKLEPIPYDMDAGNHIQLLAANLGPDGKARNYSADGDLNGQLFNSTEFNRKYYGYLNEYSDPNWINGYKEELKDEWAENATILHQEYEDRSFTWESIEDNIQTIRNYLNIENPAFISRLGKDNTKLSISNNQFIPLEILGINAGDETHMLESPVWIKGRQVKDVSIQKIIDFKLSNDVISNGKVIGALGGLERQVLIPIESQGFMISSPKTSQTSRPLTEYSFIKKLPKNGYEIQGGRHEINSRVEFPKNSILVINPGAELIFKKGGGLLSYSVVSALGNKVKPIRMVGRPGNLGIQVMNAGDGSQFEYCEFVGIGLEDSEENQYTGGVTVYESNSMFKNCAFNKTASEDALNVIRAKVEMLNCVFNDNYSDALDLDFCTGKISNSIFNRTGNDGIDFSGSNIELNSIRINSTGDKGISIGERSVVVLSDVSIANASMGITVKDLSVVEGNSIEIDDVQYGIAVFQKKKEFGGAHPSFKDVRFKDTKDKWLIEQGSSLEIDGERIEGDERKVYKKISQ